MTWNGTCEWCGGEADDHVSDFGCFCHFCNRCDAPMEPWEFGDVHYECMDEDEWNDFYDTHLASTP